MYWHAACRKTHAHRRSIRCERSGPECWNRSCCGGLWSEKDHKKKELAPGGHQEQGESRVTEFRAPDLKKHRVPKWRIESQLPLSAESISGGT